jgi:hypothetical protein
MQYDFKAQFEGNILKDDFNLVFNEESIFEAVVNLTYRLELENLEPISSNESHELRKENKEDMIFNQYYVIETKEFPSNFKNSSSLE